ncbi:hypothetical protein BKA63DRAFT_73433 [Paraphoma chrysanthemicola]|nr:hypothetical protein BKA63DRAFT_73433 [Paraphoma chrysanthemicola]
MMPIATVIAGIQALCANGSKRPDFRLVDHIRVPKDSDTTRTIQDTTEACNDFRPPATDVEQGTPENLFNEHITWSHATTLLPVLLMSTAVAMHTSAFPILVPSIIKNIGSTSRIAWYSSVYWLAYAAASFVFLQMNLSFAKAGWPLGWRLSSLAAMAIFVAGGLCCYNAANPGGMIVGRLLSGLAAGGSASSSPFLIRLIFPRTVMNWIGMDILLTNIVSFLGPLIAGAMIGNKEKATAWSILFLVSSCIAALALTGSIAFITFNSRILTRPPTRISYKLTIMTLDVIVSCGGMICFQFAMYYGAMRSWDDALVLSLLLAGCGGCLILWILLQIRQATHQHLSLKAWLALFFWALWGASYQSFGLFLVLWLHSVRGYSTLRTSILFLPVAATPLLRTCFAMTVGILQANSRFRTKLSHPRMSHLQPAALGCIALSAGLLSRIDMTTSVGIFVGLQLVFSIGGGALIHGDAFAYLKQPMDNKERYKTVPESTTAYLAKVDISQSLGGYIGIVAAQTVFLSQLLGQSSEPGVNIGLIINGGATNFKTGMSADALAKALDILNNAITRTFLVAAAAGALPIVIIAVTLAFNSLRSLNFFCCCCIIKAKESPPTNSMPTNNIPTNNIPTNNIPTNNIPTNNIPTNNMPDIEKDLGPKPMTVPELMMYESPAREPVELPANERVHLQHELQGIET